MTDLDKPLTRAMENALLHLYELGGNYFDVILGPIREGVRIKAQTIDALAVRGLVNRDVLSVCINERGRVRARAILARRAPRSQGGTRRG